MHESLAQVGQPRSLTRLIGRLLWITLVLVVVLAAIALLGLTDVSEEVLLFLPWLGAAIALLLVGAAVGQLVRDGVDRLTEQMDLGVSLGRAAQVLVLALFLVVGLAVLGIPTLLVVVLVGILAAGAALTVALAFGLGSREVARELSAGRMVASAFAVGETIGVGELRGEIVRFDGGSTVLRTATGTVRVPHHLLVESVVRLEGEVAPGSTET